MTDRSALPDSAMRTSLKEQDTHVMDQFKRILDEVAFELDSICVYVIMDKLRGMHNSAGIPEKTFKKAEQMLNVLGVNKYWERN